MVWNGAKHGRRVCTLVRCASPRGVSSEDGVWGAPWWQVEKGGNRWTWKYNVENYIPATLDDRCFLEAAFKHTPLQVDMEPEMNLPLED